MDRYLRQRLLPEIGDEGQHRLEATTVAPMGGPAGAVRDLYLRRAGIKVESELTATATSWPELAKDPALAVLVGAFEAVEALKRALEVGTPGSLAGFNPSGASRAARGPHDVR
ncbi:MAG: hypothetical protein AB8I08_07120 [Sandaracinaceae bacterium]